MGTLAKTLASISDLEGFKQLSESEQEEINNVIRMLDEMRTKSSEWFQLFAMEHEWAHRLISAYDQQKQPATEAKENDADIVQTSTTLSDQNEKAETLRAQPESGAESSKIKNVEREQSAKEDKDDAELNPAQHEADAAITSTKHSESSDDTACDEANAQPTESQPTIEHKEVDVNSTEPRESLADIGSDS